MTVITYIHTW